MMETCLADRYQLRLLTNIFTILFLLGCLVFTNIAIAITDNALTTQGNLYISNINKMVSHKSPDIKKLKGEVAKLEALQGQAQSCIDKSLEQIKSIDELLGQSGVNLPDQSASEGQQYLSDKRKYYTEDLTECRFLIFRIKESLPVMKEKIQAFSQSQILQRLPSIVEILPQAKAPSESIRELKEYYNQSDIISLGFLLAVGIGIFFFVNKLRRGNEHLKRIPYFSMRVTLSYLLLIPCLYNYNFSSIELGADPTYSFYRMIYIAIVVLSLSWLLWPMFDLLMEKNVRFNRIIIFVRWYAMVFLIFLVGMAWMGYYELFLNISESMVISLVILSLYFFLVKLISLITLRLTDLHYPSALKTHYYLGVRMNRQIHEIGLIKISCVIILTYFLIYYFMVTWGVTILFIDQFSEIINSGLVISNITIIPARVIYGLIIFSVLSLLGRLISAYFSHQMALSTEKDSQVAIASIVGYLFFAFAVLVSFLVAGVNFTGLAIIAGAFSVGIGFGLQHIVNNIICGVILLIQKPIKPGDRVIVGGAEGFVRRIRILSTQINTIAKEDIMVPNSDLITHPITNFMFRDSFWRVICSVGVKYGSNIELVKSLLMKVAMEHPDVIKEDSNAPIVLFKSFGESALQFELWCIISDVNKKNYVLSDLNSAIDSTFKEHGIDIAYPQRDIHIVDSERSDS